MPLRCCAMMGRRSGEEQQQQQQRAAAAATPATAVPRRGRWLDGEQQAPAPSSAVAGWRLRSCAAAAIADCVALGCCPCAVVALMGLALVRAPLAVGRRLRTRRRSLQRRKRVRDVAASSAAKGAKAAAAAPSAGSGTQVDAADDHAAATVAAAAAPVQQQQQQDEAEEELAWLDEMYRVGHWGFGRVSSSGSAGRKTP